MSGLGGEEVPPGPWGFVIAGQTRIETLLGALAGKVDEQTERLIRLEERQAQSATKTDFALLDAKATSAHDRLDTLVPRVDRNEGRIKVLEDTDISAAGRRSALQPLSRVGWSVVGAVCASAASGLGFLIVNLVRAGGT